MDHGDYQEIKREYESFVEQSSLEVVVPQSHSAGQKPADELQRVPSRNHIFFDELTTVYVVLRTTAAIELLLPSLELTTSAHATNATANGAGPPVSTKHEITTSKIPATDSLSIAKVGDVTHVIWSQSLHVTRSRVRLQRPAVYFTSTLTLKTDYLEQAARAKKQYLPSFQALPANVLESLSLSSAADDEKAYLSEARITKVVPLSPRADDALRPLRGVTKTIFPAVPAIIPRLRCSTLSDRVLVNLQIEAAQALAGQVNIHDVSLDVSDATIEQIGNTTELDTLQAGDEVAFLWKVVQTRSLDKSRTPGVTSITINAHASIEGGTEVELRLSWQTRIDLATRNLSDRLTWSTRPEIGPTDRVAHSTNPSDGLIFEFTAPCLQISSGQAFELAVKCINKSQRTRHFAVKAVELKPSLPNRNTIATSPEAKMSPIEAGECFEAAIQYTALAPGVLNLGQVKIIDLDSGESIEVQGLPDVVAHVK